MGDTTARARLRMPALIAVALLATIVACEVALRALRTRSKVLQAMLYSAADPVPYDGLDTTDALLTSSPFHPRPYDVWFGYKLNSHGFRTPEYTTAKPPGTYRIVALGDSFTSDSGGVPADQLWHVRIGHEIQKRSGQPVEVINLGVPGVGPRFTLRLFDLEGRHLSPDLVLLGLFVGNDLTDERVQSGLIAQLDHLSLLSRFVQHAVVLARNAPAIVAEGRRQSAAVARAGPGGYAIPGSIYDPEVALVSEQEFVRIEIDRTRIFAVGLRPQVEHWIADVVQTVAALDRSVRQAGGTLLVLVIPDVVQVDESVRRVVLAHSTPPGGAYDFDWIQPVLVRGLADAGVKTLDLLPAFRSMPSTPRLYRLRETHWSPAGNALAAEEAAAFLARE